MDLDPYETTINHCLRKNDSERSSGYRVMKCRDLYDFERIKKPNEKNLAYKDFRYFRTAE